MSFGKNDKFEYVAGEEISPSNRSQIIEQAKCMYSPLGKALEKKNTKAIGDQGEKQIKANEKSNALEKQKYLVNLLMKE